MPFLSAGSIARYKVTPHGWSGEIERRLAQGAPLCQPWEMDPKLRKVVIAVAVLNLAYFGVEFAVALIIGSVSLFADSVDFLEDASINLLIAAALGWSATSRARLGMALAGILLVPGLATLWTAWEKFLAPTPPAPLPLTLTGAGALPSISLAPSCWRGSAPIAVASHARPFCRRAMTLRQTSRLSEQDCSPPTPYPHGRTSSLASPSRR